MLLYLPVMLAICLILIPRITSSSSSSSSSSSTVNKVYVDCSKSSGNGLIGSPCPNITCALSVYPPSVGSTIIVNIADSGTCTGAGNENIVINQTASSYTFIGQGLASDVVIESSSYGNRAFLIENAINVTMKNITFRNFYYVPVFNEITIIPDSGGAIGISNVSSLYLENMIFINNTGLLGGAVSLSYIDLGADIGNCLFENNTGVLGGGALSIIYSSAVIVYSNFNLNEAKGENENIEESFYGGSGGAVIFYGYDATNILTISNSNFYDNFAFSRGGAVCYHQINEFSNPLAVYASNFYNNTVLQTFTCTSCDIEGGAVYIDSRTAYFEDSKFYSNLAGLTSNPASLADEDNVQVARGGAIYITWSLSQEGVDSVINVVACHFESNRASTYGGAVYLYNVNANITGSTYFVGNIVGSSTYLFLDFPTLGGALYFSAKTLSNTSIVDNCYFINNNVVGGWGGAIYASETAVVVSITNTQFSNNTAYSSYTFSSQGGAIMLSSISSVFFNCIFQYNSAQPIFIPPYTFSGYGGAVFAQTAVVDITSCTFSNNYAFSGNEFDSGSSGGAIFYIHSFDCSIRQSQFLSNAAVGFQAQAAAISAGKGGALLLKFSSVQISQNSLFYRNWASSSGSQGSEGGAIAVYESYTTTAGAVANSTVTDTTFIQNVAVSSLCDTARTGFGQGGGIAVSDSASFYLVNVTFVQNIAQSSSSYVASIEAIGGAIAIISQSYVSILTSSFKDNIVHGSGFGDDISVVSDSREIGSYSHLAVDNTSFSNANITSSWAATNASGPSLFECFLTQICSEVSSYTTSSVEYLNTKVGAVDFLSNKYSNLHRELSRRLTELENKHAQQQRRVLRTELRDIIPASSILLSSVCAFFNSPTFEGTAYEVFVGNVIALVDTSSSADSNTTSQLSIQQIQGGADNLKLLVFQGTLLVQSQNKLSTSLVLKNVYLINSTLSTSNNLTITGRSYLIASTINRYKTIFSGKHMPQINFRGSIVTGLGIGSPSFIKSLLARFPSFLFNSSSVYDGVNIKIYGNITVLPPLFDSPSVNIDTTIYLKNNATVSLENAANMRLIGGTQFYSDSDSQLALTNSGTIYLQGSNELFDLLKDVEGIGRTEIEKVLKYLIDTFDFDYSSYEANSRSMFSPLAVSGLFEQTEEGTIVINLFNNGTGATEAANADNPVLFLTSNQSLLGNIELNILSKTTVTLPTTSPLPTIWGFVSFKNAGYNSAGAAKITTNVPGLSISPKTVKMSSSWETYLQAESLACEDIATYYYFSSSQQLCSICSMNSSCTICASDPNTYSCVTKGGTIYIYIHYRHYHYHYH